MDLRGRGYDLGPRLPPNRQMRDLIRRAEMELMKPDVLLINTACGSWQAMDGEVPEDEYENQRGQQA